jgi:RHS repeat-associated protein
MSNSLNISKIKFQSMRSFITSVIISFCYLSGMSQNHFNLSYTNGIPTPNTLLTNAVAEVYESNKFDNGSKTLNFGYYSDYRYTKLENIIKLSIDRDALKATNLVGHEVIVTYKLEYYTVNLITGALSSLITSNNNTLSVYFNPTVHNIDKEIDVFKSTENIVSCKLTVTKIEKRNLNSTVLVTITNLNPSNNVIPVVLTNTINAEIDENFDPNSNSFPFNSNNLSLGGVYSNTSNCQNEIAISWQPFTGAKEYELEWMFVDHWIKNKTAYVYDFKNNATRIQLNNTNYSFPAIFEKGYIVYRIRGIGYRSSSINGVTQWHKTVSDWTMPNRPINSSGCNGPINFTNSIPNNCNDRFIEINNGFAPNMNWSYSVVYAEEAKSKGEISYFDGSNKSRQSIVVLNTEQKSIVGQTIYDFLGRPAIQPLAVPDLSSSNFCFKPNFNRSRSSKNQYNWKDFDVDYSANCNETKTAEMDTSKGAAWYYSERNRLLNGNIVTQNMVIPEAQGYPFVQTEYMPDNTGRIKRISGLGKQLRLIGKDDNNVDYNSSNTHQNIVYYGKPTQSDLYRIFGNEVGNAAHYEKNVTVDANGQASVAYIDHLGRTVATALSGMPPDAYTSLPGGVQTPKFSTNYYNNIPTDPNEHSLLTYESLYVSVNGLHEFEYSVTPEIFSQNCMPMGICFTCIYDLSISIKNDCGEEMIPGGAITKRVGTINGQNYNNSCQSVPFNLQPSPLNVVLNKGNYTIKKTLTVNKEAFEYYKQQYLSNPTCAKTLEDFIAEEEALINSRECNYTCETCNQDLAIYNEKINIMNQRIQNFQNEILTLTELNDIKNDLIKRRDFTQKECDLICTPQNACKIAYESMLKDVTPGGQYALFYNANNELDFTIKYSVLNTNGNSLPSNSNWRNPITEYKDENGNTFLIEIVNNKPEVVNNPNYFNADGSAYGGTGRKYIKPQSLLNVTDFIQYFNSNLNWANSLVGMHPEYACWEKCDVIKSFYDYDEAMRLVDSYDEANTKGYLNPLNQSSSDFGMNPNDPLVQLNYNTNLLDPIFQSSLQNASGTYLKTLIQNKLKNVITNNGTNYSAWQLLEVYRATVDNATSTCSNDLLWAYFRAIYLNAKQEVLRDYYNTCSNLYNTINNDIKKDRRFFMNINVSETVQSNLSQANQNLFNGNPSFIKDKILLDPTTGEIALKCDKTCTSYADEWMKKLEGCSQVNPSFVAGNPFYEAIKLALINVCKDGCDVSNAFGSTSINPTLTNRPYKSFKDVLSNFNYNGTVYNLFQAGVCDDNLIEWPMPYGHDYFAYENANAKNCACDNSRFDPVKIAEKQLECPTYTPEGQPFNDCACSQEDKEKQKLLLATKEVPVENRCNTCYTCAEVFNAAQNYDLIYRSSIPQTHEKFPQMLTNFMNKSLKLNLTFGEYKEFIAQCYKITVLTDDRVWDSVFLSQIHFSMDEKEQQFTVPEYDITPTKYAENINHDLWLKQIPEKLIFSEYTDNDKKMLASVSSDFIPQPTEIHQSNSQLDNVICNCKKILNAWKIEESSGKSFQEVMAQMYPGFTPVIDAELNKLNCLKLYNGVSSTSPNINMEDIKNYDMNGSWTQASDAAVNTDLQNNFLTNLKDKLCNNEPADNVNGDLKLLDDCACKKILEFKNAYDQLPPNTYPSFDDYVKQTKRLSSDPSFDVLAKKCLEYYQTSLGEDDNGNPPLYTNGANFNNEAKTHLKKDVEFHQYKVAAELLCNPSPPPGDCKITCQDIVAWISSYTNNASVPSQFGTQYGLYRTEEQVFLMAKNNASNPEASQYLNELLNAFNAEMDNNHLYTRCKPFNYSVNDLLAKLNGCMPSCPDLTCSALELAAQKFMQERMQYNIDNPGTPKFIPGFLESEPLLGETGVGMNMGYELLNYKKHLEGQTAEARDWAAMDDFINDFLGYMNTAFSNPPFCTRNFDAKSLALRFTSCFPYPYTAPEGSQPCSVCYRLNTKYKLEDLQAFLNKIAKGDGQNHIGLDKNDKSNWKLKINGQSNQQNGRDIPEYYGPNSSLYKGGTDLANLRYHTAGYPLPPQLNASVQDNSGHLLSYALIFPDQQSWFHWGEIINYSNIRVPPPPPCTVPSHFLVDAEIWISESQYKYFHAKTGITLQKIHLSAFDEWGYKHKITLTGAFTSDPLSHKVKCPGPCIKLCNKPIIPEVEMDVDCDELQKLAAYNNAVIRFNEYMKQKTKDFEDGYLKKCLGVTETFKSKSAISEYHYTLYYYDRAGNLVKTVPPAGVDLQYLTQAQIDSRITDAKSYDDALIGATKQVPNHLLITHYLYNSLGGVIRHETPDAGVSQYWYDKVGRMVASQNAEQYKRCTPPSGSIQVKTNQICSYSQYDELGRLVEVGEKNYAINNSLLPNSGNDLGSPLFANSTAYLQTNFYNTNTSNTNTEVTRTYYNNPYFSWFNQYWSQKNTLNRVGTIAVFKNGNDAEPTAATHYSYDAHGNVSQLWQNVLGLKHLPDQQLKTFEYRYDLISGNVHEFTYQKDKPDQFIHQYQYDADNRLNTTQTSTDNTIWQTDAKYQYMLHGPVGRMEIGDKSVQGIDYAYTIQGWLKNVNSDGLHHDRDIGKDGGNPYYLHQKTARDAFGYSLHYFNGDYSPISVNMRHPFVSAVSSHTNSLYNVVSDVGNNIVNLYNGNISQMVTALPNAASYQSNQTITPLPLATTYRYDQLNRLTEVKAFENYNTISNVNTWALNNQTGTNAYHEQFTYDANGNIKSAKRNGNLLGPAQAMDDLTYEYNTQIIGGVQRLVNNKLNSVSDAVTASNYTEDVDNQSLLNYGYDAIGNLIRDDGENIQEIKWNAYGKISSITRTGNNNKSNLEFGYDASGQRLWKTVKPRLNGVQTTQNKWITTWYIRDASGNPIATYNEKYKEQAGSGGNTEFVDEIMLIEQAIFAANRIGVIAPKKVIAQVTKTMIATGGLYDVQGKARLGAVTSSTSATVNTTRMDFYLGRKNYELSNHLGNVLAVVSDRKQMVDDGTYVNGLKANGIMDNISDYYQAEYQSFGMYYAYGAPLPSRGYTAPNFSGYRFGFNGMEGDDEIKGEGNSYTTEFRQLDPRLGRWISLDPVFQPWQSPYCSMDNNPISLIDPHGNVSGDFYSSDGKHLGSDGENDDKAYVVDPKNVVMKTDNKTIDKEKTTDEKLLSIGNKELLDRATWVYGESTGSDEKITTRTQNKGESSDVSDARVVDYYAHSINNAAKKDGGFYKSIKLRMGKMVDGKYTKTSEGYFEGKGLGGNDNSKNFANARSKGMSNLMNLTKANNAISAVISSVNGGIDPTGGTRAWLGADAAKNYVKNGDKSYSGAVFQFSFSSGNGKFYHSFYKK